MNERGENDVSDWGRRHAPVEVVRGEKAQNTEGRGRTLSAGKKRDGYGLREGTDQRELGAGPVDSERDVIAELGERSADAGRL